MSGGNSLRADVASSGQVFSDLNVIDLSRWVSGEYAAKLLGDFGANVIKVEKPLEGSYSRSWGPFPADVTDRERSALFLHLNTNKRSIELDLKDAADKDLLLRLVDNADVVIESFRPGTLERLGLGPVELHARNPNLVVTRISAFGQSGPYRDYEATGLVLQAMGGPMHGTGDAHRAPHRKPGLLESYSIGRMAGEATMAGLIHAQRFGGGSVIDISGREVLLTSADRRAPYLLAAAYSGINSPRGIRSAHRPAALSGPFKAKDGWVVAYVAIPQFFNRLVRLIGCDDLAFVERFMDRAGNLGDDIEDFLSYLSAWFLARPKMEIMSTCEAARIPVTAFLQIDELFASLHFRARDTYAQGTHPVAGPLEYLGAPWRMMDGYQLRRTAPTLGEHSAEIRAVLDNNSDADGSIWPPQLPEKTQLPTEVR